MKKFAIILSGCGVYDGAEIHEATLTMLAVEKNGASYTLFAPDIDHHHVINHITQEEMYEKRNVLIEAARIARGNIENLINYKAEDFDGLIMPGGFGVAKNLSNFAFEGEKCKVNETLKSALINTHKANKPIGALCISPAIVAKVISEAKLTIGKDESTARSIEKMGGTHIKTTHGEVVFDEKNNIYSTPCYMLDAKITDIWEGANNIVKKMIENIQ